MRDFNFRSDYIKLLTPANATSLARMHEYRGQQAYFVKTRADALAEFLGTTIVQSVGASNRIEGIVTSDERLRRIALGRISPRVRNEREISGYRDALTAIYGNYHHINPAPSTILQLHSDIFRFSAKQIGGRYRTSDKVIQDELTFRCLTDQTYPIPAAEIPEAMTALCAAFNEAVDDPELDPLLLTPLFVLHFLCVHPFGDGSARMSRLLTLLLLRRAGHVVVQHISIENLIFGSRETYFEAFAKSSENWLDGTNDPAPFVEYLLGVIDTAYREFQVRIDQLGPESFPKRERVRELLKESSAAMGRGEIMEKCPDISQVTVNRALSDLLESGEILKKNGGRYTTYVWNSASKQPDNADDQDDE